MAKTKKTCTIGGCTNAYVAKGLCQKHYGRKFRQGDPNVVKVRTSDKVCTALVNGKPCSRKHSAKNYCANHYQQWKLWGDPYGKRPPAKRLKKYKSVFKPGHPNAKGNGMIPEHRFVMSEMIGRPLVDNENVHHKNGDSLDNRPQNLELWNTYQPAGQRVEDKVNWAVELLELYAPEKLRKTNE